MSFQAWAASWSAYTVATSGRIVPSSSSRPILLSTSPDGASRIITPDTCVRRCLFLRYGLNGGYEMAIFLQDQERPLLCIATDQVEDHIDLLSQNLLELRLSIIENPAGPDGVEVRLIVAACCGNDGGTGMRCQLHRIGAHSAGATMDQDRLSLFQVTVGEESLPRSLGGHRHRCCLLK